MLSPVTYYHLDDYVADVFESGEVPLFIALDGVTDTRNFGAIARTAECAGVSAIVIPEKGSASVNADAIKTSAGALLYIPVCREKSLVDAIKYLKDSGFTIIGATEKSAINYTEANYTNPTVIVMGSEDTGISPEILKLCDTYAAIPMLGNISSLNVSVAAGVLIYEAVRQRLNSGMRPE
jgi:23S rRNA (guanosine2251-2'-O)-methyltransferase